MRLWHLLLAIVLTATLLGIAREEIGRVAIVVFITGLGEIVMGTTAIMTLFKTIAAIGRAERLTAFAEAVVSTALVVVVASTLMTGWLWMGASVLMAVIGA